MAMPTDVTLVNNDISKTLLLRGVKQFKPATNQSVMSIPFINQPAANAILFRFSGQLETVNFSYLIVDDGVDVSNGTHSSTVKTVAEQVAYIKNTFFTEDFDVTWNLTQTLYYPVAVTGVITQLAFVSDAGKPSFALGNIAFTRGTIGAL